MQAAAKKTTVIQKDFFNTHMLSLLYSSYGDGSQNTQTMCLYKSTSPTQMIMSDTFFHFPFLYILFPRSMTGHFL